jgi:hypothetical protein
VYKKYSYSEYSTVLSTASLVVYSTTIVLRSTVCTPSTKQYLVPQRSSSNSTCTGAYRQSVANNCTLLLPRKKSRFCTIVCSLDRLDHLMCFHKVTNLNMTRFEHLRRSNVILKYLSLLTAMIRLGLILDIDREDANEYEIQV